MVRETSQTLARGLTVLEAVAARPAGMTVNELAAELGVGRTVVYRLVTTLEDHQLVRRDSNGRVIAWVGVTSLARAVEPVLRAVAQPVLRALANECRATAHLTVAEGDEAVAVAVVEAPDLGHSPLLREGTRHSLEQGAAGRAVLRLREGVPAVVVGAADAAGAPQEIAAPVLGLTGLEAGVGVLSVRPLDASSVGQAVIRAAGDLRAALSR